MTNGNFDYWSIGPVPADPGVKTWTYVPPVSASITIPRRRGFVVALIALRETISAYAHGDSSITVEMGEYPPYSVSAAGEKP